MSQKSLRGLYGPTERRRSERDKEREDKEKRRSMPIHSQYLMHRMSLYSNEDCVDVCSIICNGNCHR